MFDFLKKAFGRQDSKNDIIEKTMERLMMEDQKFALIGRQIADDCIKDGLSKGKVVTLSEMERFIASNHLYNTGAVINGFLTRMHEHIKAEEIINFPMEGGNMFFVHKNEAASFLQNIMSGKVGHESIFRNRNQDSSDGTIRSQETLAHEVALFLADINNASESLARLLEGILPAQRAIELLSHKKKERASPVSGWVVNAALGYSGGTRQGFIKVEDPKLVSFLQLDNPKVYVMTGAKVKKDNYSGYFSFSYYLHSGNLANDRKQDSIRKDPHFIDDILRQFNFPASLPDFFQRAGHQNLSRKWMAIAQQSASVNSLASRSSR